MNTDNLHPILYQNKDLSEQQLEAEGKPSRLCKKDYDLYLVGRSYAVFKRACKTERTLEFYRRNLCYFLSHVKLTTEQIVEKYSPYIVTDTGEHRPNIMGQIELQKIVEGYCLFLAERVDKGEIKPTSVVTLVPAIKLFLEMSDILINWKKINKLLPRSNLVADDEAYTRENIQRMLQYMDLRGKVILLLLASSGMRLEGLSGLRMGDIEPIYDPSDSKRVIAAHVKVYAKTESEYSTFITPEAWDCLTHYLDWRKSYGETITKHSPVLIRRFNREMLKEGKQPPALNYHTIQDILITARKKAGVDARSAHYDNKRFTIKSVHGTRKFWNTAVKSVKTKEGQPAVNYINKERMLGHSLPGNLSLEDSYDRSDIVKELLQDYLRALDVLTISDEARLALKVVKLEKDVSEYRTLDVELSQKDKQIRDLTTKMEAMQKDNDEIKEFLRHPEKLAQMLRENEEK